MPVTPTYVALAEVTLAATATSVTLPVPTGYKDIIIVSSPVDSVNGANLYISINGDTSNYSYIQVSATNVPALNTTSGTERWHNYYGYPSITAGETVIISQFFDVLATDKHKTYLARSSNASTGVTSLAGRWASTAAITSFVLSPSGGTFVSGSTFNMYGIEA